MAKGYNTDRERKDQLASFGKDLARRAKSRCEISGEAGVSLVIYEVPPVLAEPDFDQCLFISESAFEQITSPKKLISSQWRILGEQIWSDLLPIQILSVRMLTHIAKTERWAQEILDNAYLDESIMDAAEKYPL